MNRRSMRMACTILCLFAVLLLTTESVQAERKGRKYFENRGEVVWEISTDKKVTALTFDDGPDPTYTPQILDLLHQYNAKATFFTVGSQVKLYPELAKREASEGHELANHTYSHPDMYHISAKKLQEEIVKTDRMINEATGVKAKVFRPPGGHYNETIVETAKAEGYMVVIWSWDQNPRDWSRPGVRKIVNRVLANAHNGGIVLFHDHGEDRSQTVAALKEILPELQHRGYQFVTVSELLKMQNSHPSDRSTIK